MSDNASSSSSRTLHSADRLPNARPSSTSDSHTRAPQAPAKATSLPRKMSSARPSGKGADVKNKDAPGRPTVLPANGDAAAANDDAASSAMGGTGGGSNDGKEDGPKGRMLSCTECKRRKIKCDRECPCGPCLLRNEGSKCKQVIRWEAGCSLTEFQQLQNRVRELEGRVKGLEDVNGPARPVRWPNPDTKGRQEESSRSPSRSGSAGADAQHMSSRKTDQRSPPRGVVPLHEHSGQAQAQSQALGNFAPGWTAPGAVPLAAHKRERDMGDEDAAMMLEDYAMGNRINTTHAAARLASGDGAAQGRGKRSRHDLTSRFEGSSDLPHLVGAQGALARDTADKAGLREINGGAGADNDAQHSPTTSFSQRSADSAPAVAYRILCLSPSPEIVRRMVAYYFDHLDWYTRVLHRSSVEAVSESLLSLPPEVAARRIRPASLCIHFLVLCLALHLCGPEEVAEWGMDRPQAAVLCDQFNAGAYQLLWASDFIGSHQVEHLQAVILMSVYAYNLDDSDAAWALVGASIKIAQNLRLNRLDDPRVVATNRSGAATSSAAKGLSVLTNTLDREIGRRVWWYLTWLDVSHALSHGGCYSILPAHNATAEPMNVDDDALNNEGHAAPKSLSEYTTSSFSIFRLRFLLLYRETIDLTHQRGGPTYAQVMEMDKKLLGLMQSLPEYFALRIEDNESVWNVGDTNRDLELLSINLTAHNRLLRLHRPHLIKGLAGKDQTTVSARRCIDASKAILRILRHAKRAAPMLLKMWINVYYGFGAAVVVFLALCYETDQDSEEAEAKRAAVNEMADICSTASHLSAGAKNTGTLLRGLLEAEVELRRGPKTQGANTKRKKSGLGDEGGRGPFFNLVARVLGDATSQPATSLSALQKDLPMSFDRASPHLRRSTSTSFARGSGPSFGFPAGLSSPLASSGPTQQFPVSVSRSDESLRQLAAPSGNGVATTTGHSGFAAPGPLSPWGGSTTSSSNGVSGGERGRSASGAGSWVKGPVSHPVIGSPHGSNGNGGGTGNYPAAGGLLHTRNMPSPGLNPGASASGLTPPLNLAGQSLTNLLDEDIFSTVFSEAAVPGEVALTDWGANEWEAALAQTYNMPQSNPQAGFGPASSIGPAASAPGHGYGPGYGQGSNPSSTQMNLPSLHMPNHGHSFGHGSPSPAPLAPSPGHHARANSNSSAHPSHFHHHASFSPENRR
ncbi:hypothetical protein CBOM_05166 [Ceraceosorus bombacis]|uniref:Zn(2)-C6 fungal-type domain-containing protein n=1 Tax=Ceraceosorus bombacis TaxID=401625 RepID=A0A0P1BHY9_9BASI|nr:hypothetical protein CBOM_05166 [Ceraceosorus bombacis]